MMRQAVSWSAGILLYFADRIIPKKRLTLIRTVPDFDDQGTQFLKAWNASCGGQVVWLMDSGAQPASSLLMPPHHEGSLRLLYVRSLRGLWAYLRADLVVHTTGTHQAHRPSGRKLY